MHNFLHVFQSKFGIFKCTKYVKYDLLDFINPKTLIIMNRLKKLKFTALVALLFLFIGAGAMSSCRDTKKKEDTEMSEEHAESEEHPTKRRRTPY